MHAWIKKGMLVLVTFFIIWVLMITYWRTTNRMPTIAEISGYLFILPVAFLCSIWVARKLMLIAANKTPNVSSNQEKTEIPDSHLASQINQHEQSWTLTMVTQALRSLHGINAEQLIDAAKSGKARPGLDAELLDEDGYPLRSGRIADVQIETTKTQFDAWLATSESPALSWAPEQLRALSLGGEVIHEISVQLSQHAFLETYKNARSLERNAVALPMLHILPLLPNHWPHDHRQIATKWFVHLINQQGWPSEKIIVSPFITDNYIEPLSLLDRIMVQTYRQTLPCFYLLIACESLIGQETVNTWISRGQLTQHILGEGAIALLLADRREAIAMTKSESNLENHSDELRPYTQIHRVAQGHREHSVEAGRPSSETFIQVAQDALQMSAQAPEQITLLVADTNHHSRRIDELYTMAYKALPTLELQEQCIKVAEICGTANGVSSLTALAIAHQEVSSNGKAALCVSNQDAHHRVAVVVTSFSLSTPQVSVTSDEPIQVS